MNNRKPDIPDYYNLPNSFLQRYSHYLKCPDELSSIEELKQFWVFAIEQGQEDDTTRDFIARMTVDITLKSPAIKYIRKVDESSYLKKAYDMWCTLEYIDESPVISNQLWTDLLAIVKKIE